MKKGIPFQEESPHFNKTCRKREAKIAFFDLLANIFQTKMDVFHFNVVNLHPKFVL